MNEKRTIEAAPPLLFIFLDGLGIGGDDPALNPLAGATPRLDELLGPDWKFRGTPFRDRPDLVLRHIDPVMGVPGLPQSATGQCSLITGRNCQEEIGGHWGPRPNSRIRKILKHRSLFSDAHGSHPKPISFAAAFPKSFFAALASGRRIPSSLQQAFLDAGGTLGDELAFRSGDALSSDITGARWHSHLGYSDTPVFDPETAADRLLSIAAAHRFTLYEYWYSDHLGHRGSFEEARQAIVELDRFLAAIIKRVLSPAAGSAAAGSAAIPPPLVVISSDHGNVEDFSSRTHTANMVPFIAAGPGAGAGPGSAGQVRTIAEAGRWMSARLRNS
jgi:hypothetical protein